MQQSGGLAASIAGLFFGNAVGMAAGGTAFIQDIKGTFFPGTEFRSAFAQNDDPRWPRSVKIGSGAESEDPHRLSLGRIACRTSSPRSQHVRAARGA